MLRLKNIVSKGLCKVVTFGLALGMTLCITNVVRGESRYLAITSNTKLYNGSTMETDSGYIPAGDQHLRVHVASVTAGGNLKATRWT